MVILSKTISTKSEVFSIYKCVLQINVPKGFYAYLTITGVINSTTMTVTDSVGNSDWVASYANKDPFFLLNPQFSVYLETKAEGTLGMKVNWDKIGTFNPSSEPVLPNTVPIVKSSADFDNGLLIYSNTNVSLVSIRPPTQMEEIVMYMRNTVVFDGRSIDDKLIGNLWQMYQLGNHVVSSGKYLTLYSFLPSIKTDSYALIQDYENVKQFSTYKGVSCFADTLCNVIIDARKGPGAAIRMSNNSHYLDEVDLAKDSTLTVYTGTVDPAHQLVQYTDSQKLSAGQKFNGLFTTYMVDNSVGIVYQSTDILYSNWSSIFDGRNGIMASKNYGSFSSDQNLQETFTGPSTDVYKMTLNVKNAGLTDGATLSVIVSSGGNIVFNENYSSKKLPPAIISSNGNIVSIKYDTNGSETSGIFLSFEFKLESSSGSTSTLSHVTSTSVPPTRDSTGSTIETTTKLATHQLTFFVFFSFFFLHSFCI
ncbi:hypothetical protein CAEBREN_00795 [Caenorhabditis brenneri]|uniref:Uncharacterized protein n=1 Tax=Caenorhabditis brenneri TaxID=135651 RepID=G0NTA4_CAEBE|nr:hypothetical protein CAEBREN_00795 [Caenorhabditis brenneri]